MARDKLIQIRRDVATTWTSVNPILAAGEIGLETNTNEVKIGDGVTTWSMLPYYKDLSGYVEITDIGSTVQAYNANTTTAGNTFNGADQLVKLDATGKLPAIDGSSLTNMPVALPSQTGYAGKYLKTDGTAATWESTSTGGFSKLVEITTSGESVVEFDFTSYIAAGYTKFRIDFDGVAPSADRIMSCQAKIDDVWLSTVGDYMSQEFTAVGATLTGVTRSADTYLRTFSGAVSLNSQIGIMFGTLLVQNPTSTTSYKHLFVEASSSASTVVGLINVYSRVNNNGVLQALKFYFSNDTFLSGAKISLYGAVE